MNTNYKKVKQILLAILGANLGVAVAKIIVGTAIQSGSLLADGFHSLSDGSSNIIGLIGVSFASKPVDEDHPYGHHKFETLAGLFIAAMLFSISGKIIYEAIPHLFNPIMPNVNLVSIVVLLVTLGINIFISTYEYRMGKKLDSYVLMSDAIHTRSDIFISLGVLATLLGLKFGLPAIIDPIISLVISGFIIKAGFEVFSQTVGVLTDKAIFDTEEVKKIVMEFEAVKEVHGVKSRGTETNAYLEMHILIEPTIDVATSHQLSHDIEKTLRNVKQIPLEVNLHIEPFFGHTNKV